MQRQRDWQPVRLPQALRRLAHDEDAAPFLLLALLLDTDSKVAGQQHEAIERHLDADSAWRVRELAIGPLRGLPVSGYLPLAIMAFAALHALPRETLQRFSQCSEAISHSGGQISLFAYCLSRLLQVQIQNLGSPRKAPFGTRKLSQVREPLARLLAVVAWAGNLEDPGSARRAWLASWHQLFADDSRSYRQPATVLELDSVWQPLDALSPIAKELLLEAVTVCIRHNQQLNVAETELLRTICGILHCPLPGWLQAGY